MKRSINGDITNDSDSSNDPIPYNKTVDAFNYNETPVDFLNGNHEQDVVFTMNDVEYKNHDGNGNVQDMQENCDDQFNGAFMGTRVNVVLFLEK